MENLFNKIKSIYISDNIFSYIGDNNFKLKLFYYSKFYQNKLNLKVIFQEKYLKKLEFNISNYLYINKYNKDYLNNKYDEFLLKNRLNKKEFETIIYNVLENKNIENIDKNIKKFDTKILINIDSPLFELILKTKNFENNYIVYIYEENIDDNYKFYYNIFNNSNNTNIKYLSICYNFKNIKKLNYLKELNIDFNKINYMHFINQNKENNNCILFENINNFLSLKYLYLDSYNMHKNDKIELNNLEVLSFINCEYINLLNIFCDKLEILNLGRNQISNINNLEYKK